MSSARAAALALVLVGGDHQARLRRRFTARFGADVDRELARLAVAPPDRAARVRWLAEEIIALRGAPAILAYTDPAELEQLIQRAGVVALACAVAGQPARALAELAASLGDDGAALCEFAAAWPSRLAAGQQRAALSLLDGIDVGGDRFAMFGLGARALASHLSSTEAAQVAQRLPVTLGERWLREVSAAPTSPFAWDDLVIR